MKKLTIFYTFFLLLSFTIKAQELTLKSDGANGESVKIISNQNALEEYKNNIVFENGVANIKLPKAGLYWVNNLPIYIENKDEVIVIFNTEGKDKRFRSIVEISSKNTASKLFYDLNKHWQNFNIKTSKKTIDADELINELNIGDKIINSASVTDSVLALARFYNRALSFGKMMSMLSEDTLDSRLYDVLDEAKYNSPYLGKLSQTNRMNFYNQYFPLLMKKEGVSHQNAYDKVDFIATHMSPSADLDQIIENFTNYTFRFKGLNKELIKVLPVLKSKTSNEKLLNSIEKKANEYAKTSINKIAPEFTLADVNGKPVKLSDFKGKVVIADIWATWCGVCRDKMPHYLEYRERYKENDSVVFLTISIDGDYATKSWKKYLDEHNLKDIELIAAGEEGRKFKSDYKALVVPKYLLIGKDGKMIVDPGTFDKEFIAKMEETIAFNH